MPRTRRSPLIAAAAFLVLFLGVGVSNASAWSSRSAGFHGRFFAPRARFGAHARPFAHVNRGRFFGPRFRGRPFVHRSRFFGSRFAARPFFRPFRLVRVFVYDPYPRWVYRRAYYGAPGYYDPYCY